MTLSPVQQQMAQVLQQESEQVAALAAILESEYEVLQERDADRLAEIVTLKEGKLRELGELAEQRTSVLGQAGIGADREGFTQFLDSDPSGALLQQWAEVEEALQRCQHQNQVNGKLLDIGKHQAEELLSVLLGRESGASKLYDRNGNTSTSFGTNGSIKV